MISTRYMWCVLSLSLQISWQICFLSATVILTLTGIMPYESSTFSKILILVCILSIYISSIPKSWLIKTTIHNEDNRMSVNGDCKQCWGGGQCCRSATFFSNDHSLYAPMYLGWTSCLISFAWDHSTYQERVGSDKIQNEKFLPTVWLEPTTLRFQVCCSIDWSSRTCWMLFI